MNIWKESCLSSVWLFLFQDVSNQVVLITGGGGGVGRELALRFAEKDAVVIIWDVNNEGEYLYLEAH